MKLLQRTALIALTAATSLGIIAPAASASDGLVIYDGYRGGGPDIAYATVEHTSTRVKVNVDVTKISIGDLYTLWVDTRYSDGGPEYKIEMMPNSDFGRVSKVETFAGTGTRISCNWTGRADKYGDPIISFSVPRSCLGNPSKVRVSVRARFANETTDYVPGKDKLSSSV